jgi:hypothetical protein
MQRIPCALLLLIVLPAALPARAGGDPQAPAPETAAVTQANLLANERYWPFRVALTAPWQPPGREKPLPAGSTGILIRVEASGAARIDFSADGKYAVPVARTDLLESANRIRRGALAKNSPTFTLAIATHLVDPASDPPRGLNPEVLDGRPGFLCVFADPKSEPFAKIAAGLAPLRDRHGVLTILFPQGGEKDPRVIERLRSLGWTVPFPFDFLAGPYTRTLIPEETPLPALLLQTNEGRVVFQSGWRENVVPELTAALDAAFGAEPATPADAGAHPDEEKR